MLATLGKTATSVPNNIAVSSLSTAFPALRNPGGELKLQRLLRMIVRHQFERMRLGVGVGLGVGLLLLLLVVVLSDNPAVAVAVAAAVAVVILLLVRLLLLLLLLLLLFLHLLLIRFTTAQVRPVTMADGVIVSSALSRGVVHLPALIVQLVVLRLVQALSDAADTVDRVLRRRQAFRRKHRRAGMVAMVLTKQHYRGVVLLLGLLLLLLLLLLMLRDLTQPLNRR